VLPECLEYAIEHNAIGVYGGTTSYQRRQINRAHERVRCPGCGSLEIFTERNIQLCVSCGISWRAL
jgi:hypothetical protein